MAHTGSQAISTGLQRVRRRAARQPPFGRQQGVLLEMGCEVL
jgi:hypothetical protein